MRPLSVDGTAPCTACPWRVQQKVSAKELETLLSEERKMPIVIDFYATWCGPCILLAKQLEEVRTPLV